MDKDHENYERERMARMMGLMPNSPENWPTADIDRLVAGEKDRGVSWLYNQLRSMYTAPKSPAPSPR